MGKIEMHRILVGTPEEKRLFGWRRRRMEINEEIKCDRRRLGEFDSGE
jgi:hypothetical protein